MSTSLNIIMKQEKINRLNLYLSCTVINTYICKHVYLCKPVQYMYNKHLKNCVGLKDLVQYQS